MTWTLADPVAVRGGEALEGGVLLAAGTVGQPDAGLLRGGGFTLAGGFWGGGETATAAHRIYLPLVLRVW